MSVARLPAGQDYFKRLISTAIMLAMMLTMAAQISSFTLSFGAVVFFALGAEGLRFTCGFFSFLVAFLLFVGITSFLRRRPHALLFSAWGQPLYRLSSVRH
jgi:hypothetical protein